ncbi:MAG: hypothetical protein RIT14_159 [Pseudomonadota bacterium]
MIDILTSQLADPFRVGLLVALVATTRRTQGATGTWLPLALGVGFVAAMIPTMLPVTGGPDVWLLIGVGVVANLVILAAVMLIWSLVDRLRASRRG